MSPKEIFAYFKQGASMEETARRFETEPEFIEAIIRAVAVGIEIGMANVRWNESEG